MAKVALTNMQGAAVGEIELSDNTFGVQVNESAMHLVVRAQLNAQRQGTQSAKTRTEVRGGGRKIYRQKGTGNARHHSNRAPQFKHGGVVFAPKPRDYSICVPRKVRRLAMKSALTSKVLDGSIIVLDNLTLAEGKTKLMAEVMKNLGSPRKALVVTPGRDENVVRASMYAATRPITPAFFFVIALMAITATSTTSDAIAIALFMGKASLV